MNLNNVLHGCFAIAVFSLLSLPAMAQDAAPLDVTDSRDYGDGIATEYPDYTGDEIPIQGGRVIFYRVSDPYDEYEAADGSNAVFIDMKTGKTRNVLPKGSDKMLFFLTVVYDGPPIFSGGSQMRGIGYVARVGTREDYKNGRLDMIVGRFSDLEQRQIYENVRFVDSPTHVGGQLISMVVWPEDMEARFTEIDLASLAVTKSEKVDLPKPVEIIDRPCACGNGELGESKEVRSPWKPAEGSR